MQVNEYKPLIVAFCCNWCSYAGADLAGNNRLAYPADVKIIRVPCSCRVNPMFILRAFQRGADGVIICGCHPGDCHYTSGILLRIPSIFCRNGASASAPAALAPRGTEVTP